MSKEESLEDRLNCIREKRGYLLPHHGLLAVSDPDLLQAYDRLYSALALGQRQLSRHDHEAVWIAILIAMRESLATHHIAHFKAAGGSEHEFTAILNLTAFLEGASAYDFIAIQWQSHLPEVDVQQAYLQGFKQAASGLEPALAHLCAAAVHAALGQRDALVWQIQAIYKRGIAETDLAEALSLMMFPGSVPRFVRAAETWRKLILAGEVTASADFQAWAEISGQGGYDQTAAKAGETSRSPLFSPKNKE